MKLTACAVTMSLVCLGLELSILSSCGQTPAPHPAAGTASSTPAPAAAFDFGDGKSSTLTSKAWQALDAKNYEAAKAYANQCIASYKAQAVEMQATLKAPAPADSARSYWALNDVGTCYLLLGQALDAQGDKKGAMDAYKSLTATVSYAQCWDPKGWFWAPADAARKRLVELQFDAAE